jgi:hypothetical protein
MVKLAFYIYKLLLLRLSFYIYKLLLFAKFLSPIFLPGIYKLVVWHLGRTLLEYATWKSMARY